MVGANENNELPVGMPDPDVEKPLDPKGFEPPKLSEYGRVDAAVDEGGGARAPPFSFLASDSVEFEVLETGFFNSASDGYVRPPVVASVFVFCSVVEFVLLVGNGGNNGVHGLGAAALEVVVDEDAPNEVEDEEPKVNGTAGGSGIDSGFGGGGGALGRVLGLLLAARRSWPPSSLWIFSRYCLYASRAVDRVFVKSAKGSFSVADLSCSSSEWLSPRSFL